MAQLIKLQDYISRYETNIYQYPSQFIRLKRENWKKMNALFDQDLLEIDGDTAPSTEEADPKGWKKLFSKDKKRDPWEEIPFEKSYSDVPRTKQELKRYFLDGMVPFQLQWASTTLREKSFIDDLFKTDERLKYYLQRFPDTYFLMYHPVVQIKKAMMEAEVILIGPFGIEIIYYLDLPGVADVHPTGDKSWYVENEEIRSKVLSPMIALRRTETFVRSVLQTYQIEFPFRKVVLAPDLSFSDATEPFQTDYIDMDKYSEWLNDKRRVDAPLKHAQLKAAEALLKHSRTTSVKRPEWDQEKDVMEE